MIGIRRSTKLEKAVRVVGKQSTSQCAGWMTWPSQGRSLPYDDKGRMAASPSSSGVLPCHRMSNVDIGRQLQTTTDWSVTLRPTIRSCRQTSPALPTQLSRMQKIGRLQGTGWGLCHWSASGRRPFCSQCPLASPYNVSTCRWTP